MRWGWFVFLWAFVGSLLPLKLSNIEAYSHLRDALRL